MKIATYNIWNADVGMPLRSKQIFKEIVHLNADIVCLQEVKDKEYHNEITEKCKYSFSCFYSHPNADEGLSIISRFPIDTHYYISNSVIATIKYKNRTILIINLHLPWDSVIDREKSVVEIIKSTSSINTDYSFILGDFNCSDNSSVHKFLLGQQSLINFETNPYWYDLAAAYAECSGTMIEPTLNIRENPRWKGKNTIETNQRFDRILLKNTYPNELPTLNEFFIFGKDVTANGYSASDHYGACAEIEEYVAENPEDSPE